MSSVSTRSLIFLSSVQKELQAERRALKTYVQQDPLLSRFFEVFLFEDSPASARRADQVYLEEVARCSLYVGLFGRDYGFEDAAGVSPTEREFDHATALGRDRLVFIWGSDTDRHPKMKDLVRKASDELVRRRVSTIPELTAALYASLVDRLTQQGLIQAGPYDESPCPAASLANLDAKALSSFVRRARAERQFPLSEDTLPETILTHLHQMAGRLPTRAAILLFAHDPQKFFPAAETRCMHFHGIEITRPVPYYQIFKGNLFDQVDSATNFVLSVINRSVGTRTESSQAPGTYEIPPSVVREAVVNAIVHRDYASAAAVQVSVFADRVEIRNPGGLTPPLTPERLRHPHSSITRNARLSEAFFLARYIEKFGTGTLMMIRESLAHALPEPDFTVTEHEFVAVLWRDWLTESRLKQFPLTPGQIKAVSHLKVHRRITKADYQRVAPATASTALRELSALVQWGLLSPVGQGRATHYVLSANRSTIAPIAPPTDGQPVESPGLVSKKLLKLSGLRKSKTSPSPRSAAPASAPGRHPVGTQSAPSPLQRKILRHCSKERSLSELMGIAGRTDRTKFRHQVMHPLLSDGLIEPTIPEKPTSSLQKYRLTPQGRSVLAHPR